MEFMKNVRCTLEDDYSYEEAETRGADLLREFRVRKQRILLSGIPMMERRNVVLLGRRDRKGTNRMEGRRMRMV